MQTYIPLSGPLSLSHIYIFKVKGSRVRSSPKFTGCLCSSVLVTSLKFTCLKLN